MKTIRRQSLALVLAALIVSPVLAQSGPGRGDRMKIKDQLNLTEDQNKKFEAIHAEAMKEQIDRRAEIGKARVELQQLTRVDTPDRTAIEKKTAEIAGLESKLAMKHIDTWFRVNQLLTPDQQKIWKNALERPMGPRSGMRGRPHHDGFGMRGDRSMKGRPDRPSPRR